MKISFKSPQQLRKIRNDKLQTQAAMKLLKKQGEFFRQIRLKLEENTKKKQFREAIKNCMCCEGVLVTHISLMNTIDRYIYFGRFKWCKYPSNGIRYLRDMLQYRRSLAKRRAATKITEV